MYCQRGRSTPWLRQTQFLGNEWNSLPQDIAERPHILHVTGSFSFGERLERLRNALS